MNPKSPSDVSCASDGRFLESLFREVDYAFMAKEPLHPSLGAQNRPPTLSQDAAAAHFYNIFLEAPLSPINPRWIFSPRAI